MKHLKTYENKTNKLKKGDFVYVELDDKSYKPNNFIGVFVRGRSRGRTISKYPYLIKYDGTYYPYIEQLSYFGEKVFLTEIEYDEMKYNL